jgi:hypothetical protein
MRKYQTGGTKKTTKKSSSTTPSRKILPREHIVSYMERMQKGGKKPAKESVVVDDLGFFVNAKEAAKRDKNLKGSIGEYGGYDYIKKQMGEGESAASMRPSFPTSRGAAASSTYVKKPIVKKKMAKGGSLPDFNKDGKITKKDVLIGRGVLPKTAKKGTSKKKAMGGMSMSKLANMKKGGKTAKCKYGCK